MHIRINAKTEAIWGQVALFLVVREFLPVRMDCRPETTDCRRETTDCRPVKMDCRPVLGMMLDRTNGRKGISRRTSEVYTFLTPKRYVKEQEAICAEFGVALPGSTASMP
jgi:hypothetical protein